MPSLLLHNQRGNTAIHWDSSKPQKTSKQYQELPINTGTERTKEEVFFSHNVREHPRQVSNKLNSPKLGVFLGDLNGNFLPPLQIQQVLLSHCLIRHCYRSFKREINILTARWWRTNLRLKHNRVPATTTTTAADPSSRAAWDGPACAEILYMCRPQLPRAHPTCTKAARWHSSPLLNIQQAWSRHTLHSSTDSH